MTLPLSSLVASAEQGDRAAADALFTALYDELHRMARRELARRGAGVTLGATTLLHEAYLDISGREGAAFPDRNRFMGYASRVMRGLIIDYARSRQAQKRGGAVRDHVDGHRRRRRGGPDAGPARRSSATRSTSSTPSTRGWRGSSTSSSSAASRSPRSPRCMDVSERTVQRDWEKARDLPAPRCCATEMPGE